jgi:hypothetical protein
LAPMQRIVLILLAPPVAMDHAIHQRSVCWADQTERALLLQKAFCFSVLPDNGMDHDCLNCDMEYRLLPR